MHACDWPCNWVKWGLPGKCLHANAGAFCTCVSNSETVWERQLYMPTRKGRMSELIGWFFFFFYARLEKDREAEWFEAFILPAFTCLLFRFLDAPACFAFTENFGGIVSVNSAGANCRKSLYSSCLRAWFSSSPRKILWLNEMDSE